MNLKYVEVVSCSQEPDLKILEQSIEDCKKNNKQIKEKIRYLFEYRVQKKELLPSGKEYVKTEILTGKSKIILKPGFQFLEVSEGAINNSYWFTVEATHTKIGK